MAIVRRISLLQYFYAGIRLYAAFDELKKASQRIQVQVTDLKQQRGSHFSSRRGKRINANGLVGHIDLSMDGIESLWPYLYLGQWLNVGKKASWGFGSFGIGNGDQFEIP